MTWLAVDPSLRNTGWAVMCGKTVYKVGLITTERDPGSLVYLDNQRCLELIACGLRDACGYWRHEKAEGRLDRRSRVWIYAEAKGGSKSAKAAAAMAMAQGVLIGSLTSYGPITLMLPKEVKKVVCGSDKASKDDIRAAVNELYPDAYDLMLETNPDYRYKKYNEHIYDAIAIGYAINKRKKGLV